MKEIVSVENMRKSDAYTIENYISSRQLMYKAGQGVYDSVNWQGKTLIVAGSGNNAGDGYVLSLILKENGKDSTILLLSERLSPDGEYYFNKCKDAGIEILTYNDKTSLDGYDIIVDCIFGTGFKGEVSGVARDVIEKINKSKAYVVSVDINSGLNGDSGMCHLCVESDLTVSIGTLKSGHILNMAKDKIGALVNCDIGIKIIDKPYYLIEKEDIGGYFPKRKSFSHKGNYGYIALIGGSFEYSGAIRLANMSASAMRLGSGVVKVVAPESICHAIMPSILESTLFPLSERDGAIKFCQDEIKSALGNVKAVAVGMGMGQRGDNRELISYILNNYEIPLVIDADGLSGIDLDEIKNSKCTVVLTPHLKEFERLSGVAIKEIESAPIFHAKELAKKSGAIVLLKGPCTIVTDGESVLLSNTGSPSMASAGSGDVLSGILCSLLGNSALKGTALERVAIGAFINGYAGECSARELGETSALASDTAKHIARAIKELTSI
ncbi:MAG: NAD(P)H-hydrate dehydratase [Clostridia bacterium]|nr:NAD(P)H-hydrate dehydratase [Clostridia bacterium]